MKPLYAFINTVVNRELSKDPMLPCGYANGYVAIPPEHPMYGKHYDDVNVNIHGGLTFGEKIAQDPNLEWWNSIEPLNFEGGYDDIPKDYWIFGFDTCHYNDGPHLNRDWCIKETKYLMEQLEAMS